MGSDLVVLNIWDKYIGVIWREFRRHKQYCVTTLAKAKWLTSPVTQWRPGNGMGARVHKETCCAYVVSTQV